MGPPAQAASFETIARELSPQLLRYLRRLVRDDAAAEDVLQETLIRVARSMGSFEGRSSMKTWAFSIATRAAADHFRTRMSGAEMDHAIDLEGVAADDAAIDERLVIDEMNACVRHVIESLPPDYRAAMVLHDLEGLTAEQTAQVCGCSVATAKIRIHRARERLRKALGRQCDFYVDSANVLRCDRKR